MNRTNLFTMNKTTPQAVSRALHRAGIKTVPDHTWQGVRVARAYGGTATVFLQFDIERHARILGEVVENALTDAGYAVEPNPHNPAILEVSKP